MQLRGLGDDYTDTSSADYSLPVSSSGSALGPAISGPSSDSGAGASSSGSGLNFSDIANGIAKLIPSLVTGAVVYKKATAPVTTVSPSVPYAYNPVYSGYYGATGLPAVPGYPGLTGQAAPDNTMLYIALGIAGLFVLKGLRG